ncbi:hypothetical protein Dimus_029946 [Dionaea muscipula]
MDEEDGDEELHGRGLCVHLSFTPSTCYAENVKLHVSLYQTWISRRLESDVGTQNVWLYLYTISRLGRTSGMYTVAGVHDRSSFAKLYRAAACIGSDNGNSIGYYPNVEKCVYGRRTTAHV